MNHIWLSLSVLLFCLPCFGTPQEDCEAVGDFWSEDQQQCFPHEEMSEHEKALFDEYLNVLAEIDRYQSQKQDWNASGTAAIAALTAQIARYTAIRDAATKQGVKDRFQAKIDRATAQKDYWESIEWQDKIDNFGQIISGLKQERNDIRQLLEDELTP